MRLARLARLAKELSVRLRRCYHFSVFRVSLVHFILIKSFSFTMRLIDVEALIYDNEPVMIEVFDERKLPEYAILSHTWEEEELLYQDFHLGPQHEFEPVTRRRNSRQYPSATVPDWGDYDVRSESSDSDADVNLDSSVGDEDHLDVFSQENSHSSPGSRSFDHHSRDSKDLPSTRHVKKGWNKVLNASLQACRDGYRYIWIDTCCIDKTSSAELSEAINSMYRWYSKAAICYAYLCDCYRCPAPEFEPGWEALRRLHERLEILMEEAPNVSISQVETCSRVFLDELMPGVFQSRLLGFAKRWLELRRSGSCCTYHFLRNHDCDKRAEVDGNRLLELTRQYLAQEPVDKCTLRSFSNSRWFMRGWTLQELLAPARLQFLDQNWQSIGWKISDARGSKQRHWNPHWSAR